MSPTISGPLTDADYRKINQALRALENLHMEIQRALQAGFDCQQEDAECQQTKARLEQIKRAYFPHMP